MSEDGVKAKRKAKSEDGPEKKQKLESVAQTTFEVQPEIENFQREALWRSLQDYKRRAAHSQDQLEKLQRTSTYHDDHLRLVDIWWDQLVEEIQIMSRTQRDEKEVLTNGNTIDTHLFDTAEEFTGHLTTKRQNIMTAITKAFEHMQNRDHVPPTNEQYELQLRDVSGRLRLAELNLRKLAAEKEERDPRIADLQDRLASSQRKVDRQKSITLARIEMQARKVPTDVGANMIKVENDIKEESKSDEKLLESSNNLSDIEKEDISGIQSRLVKSLEDLQMQIATLKEQNSELSMRIEHPKDSDVEKSAPFRELKSANEFLRGQNEFLQRLNTEANQESRDLKAERAQFRDKLVREHILQYEEVTQQLTKTEHDLARVRNARDELHSSLQMKKAQEDTRAASAREISELADAQATRISALEAEIARLKADQTPNGVHTADPKHEDASLSVDELLIRLEKLQKENESLKNELPTMEQAFNQAHEQNMRKVMDLVASEEKVSRLQAEKSKADQKYFAAMKAKDQLALELKVLKIQSQKSSETVARLHEAEESLKARLHNLEQQLSVLETSTEYYKLELSKAQALLESQKIQSEEAAKQITTLIGRAENKERDLAELTNSKRTLSAELEKLKKQYDRVKSADQPATNVSEESDQLQVYRGIAMCSVCNTRWKDTGLTSCGHVFCKECVDKRVETRQRRCPSCNKGFGSGDILSVHL